MIDLTQEIEWGRLVGRVNADTSYLKPWQLRAYYLWRKLTRFCHFRLGLPTTTQIADSVRCIHCGERTPLPYEGYRIEFQAICTSESIANEMVKAGGADFFQQILPKDFPLPPSNVSIGEAQFSAAGPDRNFRDKKEVWVLNSRVH